MHRDKGIRDSKGMYCLHGHLPHLFTLGGGGGLLSPAAKIIPKDEICSGLCVELLQDNMTLSTQLDEVQGTSTMQVVGISSLRLHEISSPAPHPGVIAPGTRCHLDRRKVKQCQHRSRCRDSWHSSWVPQYSSTDKKEEVTSTRKGCQTQVRQVGMLLI